MHAKYEVSISYGSKVIAKVKVENIQTNRQTNKQTGQKQYAPDHSIRWHKKLKQMTVHDHSSILLLYPIKSNNLKNEGMTKQICMVHVFLFFNRICFTYHWHTTFDNRNFSSSVFFLTCNQMTTSEGRVSSLNENHLGHWTNLHIFSLPFFVYCKVWEEGLSVCQSTLSGSLTF